MKTFSFWFHYNVWRGFCLIEYTQESWKVRFYERVVPCYWKGATLKFGINESLGIKFYREEITKITLRALALRHSEKLTLTYLNLKTTKLKRRSRMIRHQINDSNYTIISASNQPSGLKLYLHRKKLLEYIQNLSTKIIWFSVNFLFKNGRWIEQFQVIHIWLVTAVLCIFQVIFWRRKSSGSYASF